MPCRGQSTKLLTKTKLVIHLKTHDKEYAQYNRLKVDSEKQKESSTSKGMQFRQVSLQETAELHKLWDINDPRVKKIHAKVGVMIAIDYQPVSVVYNESFKSLISILEHKHLTSRRKYL